MVAELTVVEAGAEVAASGMHHGGEMTAEEYTAMDEAMMNSMLAFPAETEGKGNPILEPTEVLADGTKVFDLVSSIVDLTNLYIFAATTAEYDLLVPV